jgi:CCR4-NOT transcription complex subunit 3
MASRKTQQEIDKTFKKVSEGIQTFEGIYEKIRQATNPTQRDKLEDNLKREIKKLQRFRDQIKSWAAGNEVKDKAPLIEQRKAIEVVSVVSTFNADPPWVDLAKPPVSAWNNSRPSKRR